MRDDTSGSPTLDPLTGVQVRIGVTGSAGGALGEFAIAYENGKLIGVLAATGGIADALPALESTLGKQGRRSCTRRTPTLWSNGRCAGMPLPTTSVLAVRRPSPTVAMINSR